MPNHGSRQLFALERRYRDQVPSNRMVQRLAQWDVKQRRTPPWPAVPVVWTCRAHIDDCFENLGNSGASWGSVWQVWDNCDPGEHISLCGRKSASLQVWGNWSL